MTRTAGDVEAVGGVAIGRNEGERLRACLASLKRDLKHVVYVDSGSSDDSLAIARELGAETVELGGARGFTAARARNAGFARLLEVAPRVEFVQFVDGDCEVVPGWIVHATAFLRDNPDVAVVCGRRREKRPNHNRYHRLTDQEWDTPVGEAKACGGDAVMRACALRAAEGYREHVVAGEEPELCVRLRKAGWRVWRLDHEMTLHDIRMSSFRQWWLRAVRSGHAYAEGAALHGAPPERHCVRQVRSAWLWGAGAPGLAALAAWPTHGASLILAACLYVLLMTRIAVRRARRQRDTPLRALEYAAMCVLAKWPQIVGILRYRAERFRDRPPALIEYHGTAAACPRSDR